LCRRLSPRESINESRRNGIWALPINLVACCQASLHECAEMHMSLEHLDTHHSRHQEDAYHHYEDEDDEDHRGEIVEHHYDAEGSLLIVVADRTFENE